MSLVLGLPRGERTTAALNLAAQLARSSGEDLVVCAVGPATWPPSLAKVDAEYQEYLDQAIQQSLDAAKATLPPDVSASFVAVRARSTPAGLLEVADQQGASMLVLGSSSAGGTGRVSLGSVADHVLHSAPIPVAMAPRGYRCAPGPGATVRRVTAGYGATGGSEQFAVGAAGLATRFNATLRLASFAVRPGPVLTAGVGLHAEDGVLGEWSRHIERVQRDTLAHLAALPAAPLAMEAVIGYGRDWQESVEDVGWTDGDLLVVGSSAVGPLARVFLGSRASKIVRNSPVPVVVLPRS
ncbi:MAG TPA: universal stress protein [Pseudonocardia sp.]|jgi:nucleotide-binding universal stress UspA family protein|nr:universal stress protein [Pseudonocardia sp.]